MSASARRIVLRGRVQGVGFRPFVHRLAHQLGVTGRVWNTSGRVTILAAGTTAALLELERKVIDEAPPLSRPQLLSSAPIHSACWTDFEISESVGASPDVSVPPDVALCADCRAALADPSDRRYRYPFINCTQCGPRFTLIDAMPYDRARTSMAGFELCAECEAEYLDPCSRRFHAEPIACSKCGPALSFEDHRGTAVGGTEQTLTEVSRRLAAGQIIAVKGLGGYHLVCDARNGDAVERLRERKRRPSKPLALMVAQRGPDGLASARDLVVLSSVAANALKSSARPIVIAPQRPECPLPSSIAPGLNDIGLLLPYTAIHLLLLEAVGGPFVVTSGNRSGEPLAICEAEAKTQLRDVVDGYLHSNRPIRRRADDSVVREIAGSVRVVRSGRGLAPLEIEVEAAFPEPVLAVGGHQNNTVAIGWGRRIVSSPHVGDLGSVAAIDAMADRIRELCHLYGVSPSRVLCDAHPDYASTRWAKECGLPVSSVFHHHAHASAAVGELRLETERLVFTWDGVGLGEDGTGWGGEVFFGRPGAWDRIASMRPFRIPGAVHAGREPWRSRAAIAWELGIDSGLERPGLDIARHAWQRDLGCYRTSAVGRLFDAAASWILGFERYGHEAQGPCELEALARGGTGEDLGLPIAADEAGIWRVDFEPLVRAVADAARDPAERAATFHDSLIGAAVTICESFFAKRGRCRVALGGGVFANDVLATGVVRELSARGIHASLPEQIPTGDGGLAFGQLIEFLGGQS